MRSEAEPSGSPLEQEMFDHFARHDLADAIDDAADGAVRPNRVPLRGAGSNNHESRKDRRKPAIELNEKPAVVVSKTSPALQLAPQDHQLTSERGILSLKPDPRLEWEAKTATPNTGA